MAFGSTCFVLPLACKVFICGWTSHLPMRKSLFKRGLRETRKLAPIIALRCGIGLPLNLQVKDFAAEIERQASDSQGGGAEHAVEVLQRRRSSFDHRCLPPAPFCFAQPYVPELNLFHGVFAARAHILASSKLLHH